MNTHPKDVHIFFYCPHENCKIGGQKITLSELKYNIQWQPCPECEEIMLFDHLEIQPKE